MRLHGVFQHRLGAFQISDDISKYLNRITQEHLRYPVPKSSIDKEHWFISKEYSNLDIEKFCLDKCLTEEETARTKLELALFRKHNMLNMLKTMKYIVDTMRKNNIVWGVGRGSSVASYVLYLIGVHKIDSIKYKLPIEEFFKEI